MADAGTIGNADLLTLKEVAEWLRVSKTTIYRLTDKRELSFVKIGGALRFMKSDVSAFIAGQRIASAEEWK